MNKISERIKSIKQLIYEIADEIKIDISLLEKSVNELLGSDLFCFPIRHHSLSSSFHLQNALEMKMPKIIFLEMPQDAEDLISFIADRGTIPPIAVFGYYKDDSNILGLNGRCTASPDIPMKIKTWYPFLTYSPEYIAIEYGIKHNIPIHFIDAPHLPLLREIISNNNQKQEEEIFEKCDVENTVMQADFLQKLFQRFENDDLDEVWDILFEIGTQKWTFEEYRMIMLSFCYGLRISTNPLLLELDGIMFREQYMKYNIENYLNHYNLQKSDCFIIVGGMHALTLPFLSVNKNKIKTMGSQPIKMEYTLIPFSFRRLSNLYGYESGIRSPQFSHNVWPILHSIQDPNPYKCAATNMIIHILKAARIRGYPLTTADAINSLQCCEMIANMRNREEPNSLDIMDALIMSCIKGNPEKENVVLQEIFSQELVGYNIGKVTKAYKKHGLRLDLFEQLARFDIDLNEKEQQISIDLKVEADQLLSEILWQISFLDLKIATLLFSGTDSQDLNIIFKEKWELRWNTSLDVKLTEKTIYGSTLEEAALNILKEKIRNIQDNSKEMTELLKKTINMNLITGIPILISESTKILHMDYNVYNLFESFDSLLKIRKFICLVQPAIKNDIHSIIVVCYYSICSQIINQANPKPENQEILLNHLRNFTNLLVTLLDIQLDLKIYDNSMFTMQGYTNQPIISGALCGVRYLLGNLGSQEIKNEMIIISKSSADIKVKFGEFVLGLVYICKNKIIFDDTIISSLIIIIQEMDWNIFRYVLPSLRKCFSEMSSREFDNILEKIAMNYNVKQITELLKINPNEKLIRKIRIFDNNVRMILDRW